MRKLLCWIGFHRGLYWVNARTGRVAGGGNCFYCGKSRRLE